MMTASRFLLRNRLLLTRLAAVVIVAAVWLVAAPLAVGWLIAGTVLVALGQGLRVWAAGHLVKQDILTTTGPFARVRHPLYWGSMLSGLGLCVASGLWWSYLLVAAIFTLVYVPTLLDEERWLRETYGEAYSHYAEAVPRFAPRLRAYRAESPGSTPATAFKWSRVIANREHQTVGATLLLLAAMWLRLLAAGAGQ